MNKFSGNLRRSTVSVRANLEVGLVLGKEGGALDLVVRWSEGNGGSTNLVNLVRDGLDNALDDAIDTGLDEPGPDLGGACAERLGGGLKLLEKGKDVGGVLLGNVGGGQGLLLVVSGGDVSLELVGRSDEGEVRKVVGAVSLGEAGKEATGVAGDDTKLLLDLCDSCLGRGGGGATEERRGDGNRGQGKEGGGSELHFDEREEGLGR